MNAGGDRGGRYNGGNWSRHRGYGGYGGYGVYGGYGGYDPLGYNGFGYGYGDGGAFLGLGIPPFYDAPPVYAPPPAYAEPPTYAPPPSYGQAPTGDAPAQPSPASAVPAGPAQACYTTAYVCPLHGATSVGAACACSLGPNQSVVGTAQ